MTDVGLLATPLQALIGGAMIGLASALMLLALGRIAGNSGLAARASGLSADGAPWSGEMAFLVGLPLGFGALRQWMHQWSRGVRDFPRLPPLDGGDSDLYGRRHRQGSSHASIGRGGMIRNVIIALASGTLFGASLAVSGMVDPARIRGFLDVFGQWDPTLIFIIGGAVGGMAVAWMLKAQMQKPIYAEAFAMPSTRMVDARLIIGLAIFGIGWGLSGLCPGPELANFPIKPLPALIFVAPMRLGLAIQRIASWRAAGRYPQTHFQPA